MAWQSFQTLCSFSVVSQAAIFYLIHLRERKKNGYVRSKKNKPEVGTVNICTRVNGLPIYYNNNKDSN